MRELYTVIHGQVKTPQDLGLRQGSFIETLDITGSVPLFANSFGNYSQVSLDAILRSASQRKTSQAKKHHNLDDAIAVLDKVQSRLDRFARAPDTYALLRTFNQLKGYSLQEINEQVHGLRQFVDAVKDKKILGDMLGFSGDAHDFFKNHDVLPRFGIVASGNLGLFESITLLYSGILAQSAQNGNQFSCIIKPSIEDYLFHDLIEMVPEGFREGFSRVTWRSDVAWDKPLIRDLVNGVDGAIYFGQRKTLQGFYANVRDNSNPHHNLYYDHFPVMVIGGKATDDQLQEAAKLAVTLCYKSKGEACLSLQDIFVDETRYDAFITYVREERKNVESGLQSDRIPLAKYSQDFLAEMRNLRENLIDSGATVSGKIDLQNNSMGILIAYDIMIDNPVLATENAAPFMAIAPFAHGKDTHIVEALTGHLRPSDADRTSDKHIYAIAVGLDKNSEIVPYLESHSHRLVVRGGGSFLKKAHTGEISSFMPYKAGIPHCGGISFLADMFGIPHRDNCYR